MKIEQFFSLIAFLVGGIGSIYVLKNLLHLSPDKIVRISASVLGHNPDQIDNLAEQKAESIIGSVSIIVALIIGFIDIVISPYLIYEFKDRLIAILIALMITLLFYVVMVLISKVVEKNTRKNVAKIIISDTFDRLIKKNKIPQYEIQSLRFLGGRYLNLAFNEDEKDIDYLNKIAEIIGIVLPPNITIDN